LKRWVAVGINVGTNKEENIMRKEISKTNETNILAIKKHCKKCNAKWGSCPDHTCIIFPHRRKFYAFKAKRGGK